MERLQGCQCFGAGFWIGGELDWMIYSQVPGHVWHIASLVFGSPHTNLVTRAIPHFFHVFEKVPHCTFSWHHTQIELWTNFEQTLNQRYKQVLKFRKRVSKIVKNNVHKINLNETRWWSLFRSKGLAMRHTPIQYCTSFSPLINTWLSSQRWGPHCF